MTAIALVRATFADEHEAERIGRAMIEAHLAACVNIDRVRSIFRWKSVVESESEAAALFKTRPALAQTLADRIAARHSYDQPVIEIWTAEVADDVARWIAESTSVS
ncbi:MAG TPA: divalent-cation tolerance protein CutA [Sphingomonas sp.]|nr:divalent-cation tolerance protein CutA [Sphingomonas sp.]